MDNCVDSSHQNIDMEVPRAKRRKLERVDCSVQASTARRCDTEMNPVRDPLPDSTALVTHKHDMCFEMVKIEVKSLRFDALGADGEDFVKVSLNFESDQLVARNVATQAYGGLFGRQHRSTLVLRELYEQHKATFRAWLIRSEDSTENSRVYELFIVVYGVYNQRDAVGDSLDCAELFLQDPPDQVRADRSALYFNPHHLYNPALRSGMKPLLEPAVVIPAEITKKQKILCDADPLKQRVQEVIDSACGPQFFAGNQQSPRIRTMLKQHENTVTGYMQIDFPCLCHGGILADDMGLGKTLTAISLIAASKDWTESLADYPSAPRTTLIVTSLSCTSHVHSGQLLYYKYYGASKGDVSSLTNYDVVLTTYDKVSNEPRDTIAGLGIGSMEWLRVILDEAHVIRNRSTKRFRAICSLKAHFRWCLTGTPTFNRVEDLGSLMAFLRVHPFDTSSTFNSRIATLVSKGTASGLEELRKLVRATSLRRNKDSIREELRLPGRRIVQEAVQLTREEQRDYDLLKSRYASILHEMMGPISTASIMQTIARLRQFCDHRLDLLPKKVHQLFDYSTTANNFSWSLFDALEASAACQHPVTEDSQNQGCLDCGHYLCPKCQKKASEQETMTDAVCKICDRDAAKSGSNSPCPKSNCTAATTDYVPSSKVQALLRNLMSECRSVSKHPIKSVVFSCWTKMLDLIRRALVTQGLDFVRIDGSKTETARREAISRFRGDQNCGILLAIIGSAGVGLDLTVASRVHIIEPQWTQTAENQAIDRVHRLGQKEEVIATRYVVKDSIEEVRYGTPYLDIEILKLFQYVLTVQDRKSTVMRQAFETDGVENVMSARERLLQVRDQASFWLLIIDCYKYLD
ncbi:hypothetical protein N8I77_009336 [Diaporthe amygdali]|uniref:Uncharacterized protein n=1 Tax=Phomopsis amygdali TaxID=1214568 RepID=A0AAD9S9C7_PHOAM|nr:hypothetical protein N8I77_009336 [Diaporthe amygdali]